MKANNWFLHMPEVEDEKNSEESINLEQVPTGMRQIEEILTTEEVHVVPTDQHIEKEN
ncbi:hypothetical protein J1N35_028022 [Gossypium stocksii]|uniref:Uncharacterized protein n=1 Tax=Gossypium stocksii TaxID=47602 RepID=A0A9D3UVL1_9ROSI|nr:hypothetical protein J1N35_028022 [Gossypium stocksii]